MDEINKEFEPSTPPSGGWGVSTPPLGGEGVLSKDECLSHYQWGGDSHGWNFVDTEAMSVKQELMPPNAVEQLHYHEKATQFFFILKGTAMFFIDGEMKVLNAHQGIEVRPGQKHRISNHSETDLEFILYSHPSTKNDRVSLTS